MADDKAVVTDKSKEAKPAKDKSGEDVSRDLLKDKEALDILKKTDKKGVTELTSLEIVGDDKAKKPVTKTDGTTGDDKQEKVKVEVKKGDTLSQIVEKNLAKKEDESDKDYAKRLYATVSEVAKANGIANPDKIKVGQKIEMAADAKPARVEPAVKPGDATTGDATTGDATTTVVTPRDTTTGDTTTGQPVVTPGDSTTTGQPVVTPGDSTTTGQPVVTPGDSTITSTPTTTTTETPTEVPAAKPVDMVAMGKKVDELYDATEGKWMRTDEDKTKEILRGLSDDERRALNDIYKERHGKPIDQMLREEMSGDDLTESLTLLNRKTAAAPVDQGKAERSAEAIDRAANGGFLGMGTDKKVIEEELKGKTAEEIRAIDAAYKQRTGISLEDEMRDEFSGADLTRMLDMVKGHNDDASRIHATLEEHKEWGIGSRSNSNCEKDLRDTISTLNSEQIAALDKTYQERYGKSLKDVIAQDDNLPQSTKDALAIYMKGTDKMTPADTLAIAELGLKDKNLEIFQEAFRSASPEARSQFLANGGEDKVNAAFGTPVYNEATGEVTYAKNDDVTRAMDYARQGKLDASTKVADNTSWIGDNEEAIELAINQMSPAEKQQYLAGKKLAETAGDGSGLSGADKTNFEYYTKMHSALDNAGNEREIAKWEDMIATGKDGSLVTRLAAHGGMFDDGMDKVLGTIENMPKEDWERLKSDPEYRKQVESTLAIDLSEDEMQRARDLLDKKMSAQTYEASKEQQRSVTESIKDETGFWNNNEEGIIKALERMTPEEQRRYREDPAFKAELDKAVTDSMDVGAERDAANSILARIAKGEKPESDIVAKLDMHSTNFNVDEAKVVADIEDAFRKDPTLRDRINNPKTDEDRALSEKFKTALGRALDPDEIEKYARPLLETGRLSMETKADLYRGVFNDDEKGFFESLKKDRATEKDWAEILADPDKTLGFLSKEEREVALNIARQKGEMRPEDELRAAMLGAGTDEDAMKAVMAKLSPEEAQAVKDAYAVKYGTSLTADALGELGGRDKTEMARELRAPQTSREAYNDARSEVYESADGIGRWVVKQWDGTGEMTADQLEQYSKAMGEYSKTYQEMPAEQRQQFEENLYKSLELYQKSEAAAGDAVVDATIIAAGVGGAAFTGGVSLSLLAYTAAGGALFKIGAKSTIMGADYDFNSSQIISDGATGAIDAATIFLGPAQAAQMLRMGEKSAITAARAAMSQVDDVVKVTGRQMLKDGAEETIERELKEKVAVAISNGAKSVDDRSIKKLAEEIATDQADVPRLQAILTQSMNEALQKEAAAGLKASMREYALNSGAGAFGGALSGGVRGGIDGESLEAMTQSAFVGALTGGAMAGGFTAAFKGVGRASSIFRHADVPEIRPGVDMPAVRALDGELPAPRLDRNGRVAEVATPDGKMSFEYHQSGPLEGQPKRIELANGTEYSSVDGKTWTVKDSTSPDGKYEVKGEMKVDADGNVRWTAENGNGAILRRDGSRVDIDKTNGTEVSRTTHGLVTDIKTQSGGVKYEYNADGNLARAEFKNGNVIETSADGNSILRRADGTSEELKGKVTVDREGTLTLKNEGGSTLYPADGGTIKLDGDSRRISEATTVNGEKYTYKYDEKGELDFIQTPDGKSMKRDEDGGWNLFDEAGKDRGYTRNEFEVLNDGSHSMSDGDRRVVKSLDGSERLYDVAENKLLREVTPEGNVKRPVDVAATGVDGRPIEFRREVSEKFDELFGSTKDRSLESVKRELREVVATGADGKPTSAYDSLMSDPRLSDQQKQNILDNLSEVREHFASYRTGDRMHADPEVNWIHTQGELAKVLEVSRKAGLTAKETEDALLASMYSDSVKFAFPPPDGAKANFHTHHLDGALAAHENLTRKGFPPERVERIVQAIKEHQIAPPEFMGLLYGFKVKPSLDAQLKSGAMTPERHAELSKVLSDMTVIGPDNMPRLKPLAEVNTWPKEQLPDGSWQLKFTPDQQELMRLSGVDRWSVPVNPVDQPNFKQLPKAEQDRLVSNYKISSTLIDGDAIDNYATLGGASKIITIRGPETTFADPNIWRSFSSIDDSFKDAYAVLSPDGKALADASLAQRNAMLHNEQNGLKAQVDDWLKSKGLNPDDVVYMQKDGKLKYPEAQTPESTARMNELQAKSRENLPPAEAAAVQAELRSLKYKGMSEAEITQFELAKEVRAKMADLLRAGHRTGNDLPGNFPSSKLPYEEVAEVKAKDLVLPLPTGPSQKFADGTEVFPIPNGLMTRMPDGSVELSDSVANTFKGFDSHGRITEASVGTKYRSFEYDADGNLVKFQNSGYAGVVKHSDGLWYDASKQVGPPSKPYWMGDIVADVDGSLKFVDTNSYKREVYTHGLDGSRNTRIGDRIEYTNANLAHETEVFERLSRENFTDPARRARFDGLKDEFEAEALERGFSENKKALFYQQLNRLMEANPAAAIPAAERADLAEQILAHAARPNTVDQGCNGTCNVTTHEVRNYVRDPERNARLVADIATSGKFVTDNGTTIDMTALKNGINPDVEAKNALIKQRQGGGEVKIDGGRDYASQLTETAMVNSYWQTRSHVIVNGRNVDNYNIVFDSKGKISGIVTDNSRVQALYDDAGKKITFLTPGQKVFTKAGKEIEDFDPAKALYLESRQVRGFIPDNAMTKIYGSAGEQMSFIPDGGKFYDAKGNQVGLATRRNEVRYDKLSNLPGTGERLSYLEDGQWKYLLDSKGKPEDSPSLGGYKLEDANRESTGLKDKDYQISFGKDGEKYKGTQHVASAEQLGKLLGEFQDAGNMPIVLTVHTANKPFGAFYGLETAVGYGGGWHVINVHGYDKATGKVRYTNQWGSANDKMTEGYDLNKLFKSMQEPGMHKFQQSKAGKVIRRTVAGAAAAGAVVYVGKEVYDRISDD